MYKEEERGPRKFPLMSDKDADPKPLDKISLLSHSPGPEEKPELDSPTEVKSKFMEEFKKLVPPKDVEVVYWRRFNFHTNFKKKFNSLGDVQHTD